MFFRRPHQGAPILQGGYRFFQPNHAQGRRPLLVGYELNLHLDIFTPLKSRIVRWNCFFIHEADPLLSFARKAKYDTLKNARKKTFHRYLNLLTISIVAAT